MQISYEACLFWISSQWIPHYSWFHEWVLLLHFVSTNNHEYKARHDEQVTNVLDQIKISEMWMLLCFLMALKNVFQFRCSSELSIVSDVRKVLNVCWLMTVFACPNIALFSSSSSFFVFCFCFFVNRTLKFDDRLDSFFYPGKHCTIWCSGQWKKL